jgi:hypothetical protein
MALSNPQSHTEKCHETRAALRAARVSAPMARFGQHPHELASAVSCKYPPPSRSTAATAAAQAVTPDDHEHRAEPSP